MVLCIGVRRPTDHALIPGGVLLGLAFEELDATRGKDNCNLYPLVAQNQVLGLRPGQGHAVSGLIFPVLPGVPFETSPGHAGKPAE